MMNPLLAVSFLGKFLGIIWVLIALFMVLIILIQKGKGGGLSAAFGGGGGAGGLLGTKTGDVLTWITIGVVVAFLLLAVILNMVLKNTSSFADPKPAATTTSPIGGEPVPADTSDVPVAPDAPDAPAAPAAPAAPVVPEVPTAPVTE